MPEGRCTLVEQGFEPGDCLVQMPDEVIRVCFISVGKKNLAKVSVHISAPKRSLQREIVTLERSFVTFARLLQLI